MKRRVAMFVFNNCTNDSRVFKEAETLIDAGYHVEVFALAAEHLPLKEIRNELIINRVEINPLHKRIFAPKKKNQEEKHQQNPENIDDNTIEETQTNLMSVPEELNEEKPAKALPAYKETLIYRSLWRVYRMMRRMPKYLYSKAYRIYKRIYRWAYLTFRSLLYTVHRPLTYYDFAQKTENIIISTNKKFDIFHAHDMNTLYTAYRIAKKQNGKLIYDSHELYVDRNKLQKPSRLYKFFSYCFEQYFARKANIVITVGERIAELMKKRYKLKKVEVIMNAPQQKVNMTGVTVKSLREEMSIPEDLKLLIYTGSITFNRGLEQLVESLKYLPDCYLVMMGYGKEEFKNKLKEIAEREKVSERFSFYGPVKSNEVIYYTRQADLGIAPIINACLSYYYCAPNKIFEYMLGGIPVISSNFPEMEKIVLENNIGYTFNPEQPESIAEAVNKIFSDNEKYKQMKQNTLKAAEKYKWENEAKKLLELYNSL